MKDFDDIRMHGTTIQKSLNRSLYFLEFVTLSIELLGWKICPLKILHTDCTKQRQNTYSSHSNVLAVYTHEYKSVFFLTF
jgi:hypothetical protein